MIFLLIVIWWALGFSSMLWVRHGSPITWGELLTCLVLAWLGPLLWLTIGTVMLTQAGFWDKPIFGNRKKGNK